MTLNSSSSSLRNLQGLRILQGMVLGAVVLGGCADKDPADTGMTTKTTNDSTGDDGSTGGGGQSETGATPVTTSGEPMTTGGGTEEGTTGAACSFLNCDDMMNVMNECDNWAQDCMDGQKCMPYANNGTNAWNATKCVDVKPEKNQPGDACTVEGSGVSGIDDCDLGVMCWEVDPETMQGTCVAQCTGSPDAAVCANGGTCFVSNEGVLNLCLPLCDPLAQDCSGTSLCIPNPKNNLEFTCILDASGDEGQAFDACEYINVCDKGLMCANPMLGSECDPAAIGCCLPFCPLDEVPSMCPGAGQECIPWYEDGTAPPGFDNVGICGIPMG
jgi:hypothetical protein